MANFLFTWNPSRWNWTDIDESISKIEESGFCIERWSCGVTRKIQTGDTAFLIRLGDEPKGIIGFGTVVSDRYEAEHWDKEKVELGETSGYNDIKFEALINPESGKVFPLSELKVPPYAKMNWTPQASGTTVPEEVATTLLSTLETAWKTESTVAASSSGHYLEGKQKQITVSKFERNPEARRACLEHYGTSCAVCEFDFGDRFGEVADGYIHVHHLVPLSNVGDKHEVDPVADLRPVCPNCHGVIHLRTPPYSLEEMREMRRGRLY